MNNNKITEQTVVLDGANCTTEQICAIAHGAKVAICDDGRAIAEKSFNVLLACAKAGHEIYGFTVGVGWNKDQTYIDAEGELTDELISASIHFNEGLIRSHVGSVGEPLETTMVRAIMASRLNMFMTGSSGIQPAYLDIYADMLNKNVIPVVPEKGSIGQADVAVLGHIALCTIGEGTVEYNGEIMPSKQAFELADIPLVDPYGKDALAMVSTNAMSLGMACLAIEKLKPLMDMQPLVYALSLEALDGNVSPLLADNVRQKGVDNGMSIAQTIRDYLKGSYLWNNSPNRDLQDPLSYRQAHFVMSALVEAYKRAKNKLENQLNHGDDNPTVRSHLGDINDDFVPQYHDTDEVQKRYVNDGENRGALFVSGNSNPITWLLDFEYLTIALSHNANAVSQRTMKLNSPQFTRLPRFLGGEKTYHAFGAMEKIFVNLAREIQLLANPASVCAMTIAGTIEDVATHAPMSIRRLHTAIDNFAYILGMELIHTAQAIDWRLQDNEELALGKDTAALYKAYRKQVEFLDEDKPLTNDFEASKDFVVSYL